MTNRELKRKVAVLGNGLTSQMGGNRSAAFRKAWSIVKAGKLELPVQGVSFGNRQEALKRLAAYKPDQVRAFLMPEPENKVDHSAVAVMVGVQNGRGFYRLGYVPRGMAAVVTAMNIKNTALRVVSGSWGFGKVTFGARVALAV